MWQIKILDILPAEMQTLIKCVGKRFFGLDALVVPGNQDSEC